MLAGDRDADETWPTTTLLEGYDAVRRKLSQANLALRQASFDMLVAKGVKDATARSLDINAA